MKKIILITLLITSAVFSKTIDATYKISYGVFGELGLATTSLKILPNNKYEIKVHAYPTGFAKILSSNKEEYYESHGDIINNAFVPNKYIKHSKNDYKSRHRVYTFNHQKSEVNFTQIDRKLVTTYTKDFEPVEKWEEKTSNQSTDFFAPNDLLSIFFNVTNLVPSFEKGNDYKLKAIGANKKDGKLDLIIPNGEKFETLNEALGDASKKFIVVINQKIFSSANGELLVSLNDEGFCNKAVLKDVLIFGDIKGEMIDFKVKG